MQKSVELDEQDIAALERLYPPAKTEILKASVALKVIIANKEQTAHIFKMTFKPNEDPTPHYS